MNYKWSPIYWIAYFGSKLGRFFEEFFIFAAEAGSDAAKVSRHHDGCQRYPDSEYELEADLPLPDKDR